MNEVKCEIKLEHGEMYRAECGPIIGETKDVSVNFEDSFVKDEHSWKREEADDKKEHPMVNKSNLKIFVNTTEAEPDVTVPVDVNNKYKKMNEIKCEVKLEQKLYTDKPIVDENEYVNVDDSFVKEEDAWKREKREDPMVNNSTGIKSNAKVSSKSFFTTFETFVKNYISEESYKCFRCNQCFSHELLLETHMRTHSVSHFDHLCSECGHCFRQQSNLEAHMRVHTGDKQFKCPSCEQCFSERFYLVTHLRVHRRDHRYECSECGKGFQLKGDLCKHKRVHTSEKSYKCSVCEKCFSRQCDFVTHMRLHTGDKPFKCSHCDKCFGLKLHLGNHMRVHTRERQFVQNAGYVLKHNRI